MSIRYRDQSYKKLKALARKVLRRHGVRGEMMIYHQWRRGVFDGTIHFHCIGITDGFLNFKTTGESHEWRKDRTTKDWDYVAIPWSDEADGALFKVIPNKSTPEKPYAGIPSVKEMRRVIAYQLSHCSILENEHAVTWSGCMSYTKWSQEDVDQFGDAPKRSWRCPKCGSFNTEACRPGYYDWNVPWSEQQGHPEPEEPPPPRRRVSLRLITRNAADMEWITGRSFE